MRAGGLNGDGGVAPVNTEAIRGTTPAKKAKALAETLISPPRCPWSYLRRLAYPQGRLLVLPSMTPFACFSRGCGPTGSHFWSTTGSTGHLFHPVQVQMEPNGSCLWIPFGCRSGVVVPILGHSRTLEFSWAAPPMLPVLWQNWTLPINIDQETAIARFRNFSMLSGLVRLTMFFL